MSLLMAAEVTTPAGTFASFAEAAEAGYPIRCAWSVVCTNAAVGAIPHPALRAVPCCADCADLAARL